MRGLGLGMWKGYKDRQGCTGIFSGVCILMYEYGTIELRIRVFGLGFRVRGSGLIRKLRN